MMDYRAFFLDENGKIVGAHTFKAMHDEDALLASRRIEQRSGLELWQGARKVAVIGATGFSKGQD